MPTNRSGRGAPTSAGIGKLRPRASVAGQGAPGLICAKPAVFDRQNKSIAVQRICLDLPFNVSAVAALGRPTAGPPPCGKPVLSVNGPLSRQRPPSKSKPLAANARKPMNERVRFRGRKAIHKTDRKSVVQGKSVDLGGRRII